MIRSSPWGVALLVLAFVVGGGVAQDKKDAAAKDAVKKDDAKKDDPKTPDKKDPEKKPPKTQSITGEIVHIEPNKQAFRLKVTYQTRELNRGAYDQMIAGQGELARAATPAAYRAAAQKIAQNQAQLYTLKSTSKELAIDGTEDLKVRLSAPKTEFDDMGNLKKFTKKELDAKRGHDKMFDGEFSDLTTGQIALVTVLVPKAPAKPVKKDDLALQEEPKIEATRIAVLKQPAPGK